MRVIEIVKASRGRLLSGDPAIHIEPSKISTDSRTIGKGAFFVPLKGPNFDGNNFIGDAFRKGALGALVGRYAVPPECSRKIIIKVEDTTKALQDIASAHRRRFKIPVIGVTGSNGKTTVKEMIWGILSKKYNVLKNEGTKNNHIGVPQTLLKLDAGHDICVLELGMNHEGEIRLLSDIAKPDMAVITNIGPSHLEFLGDLTEVFEAKKEILESLDRRCAAVLNGDDGFLSRIRSRRFRIVRFGLKAHNDFRADVVSEKKDRIEFILNGKRPFELNLLGVHNVYNALAAIAAAEHFKVDYNLMKKALSAYRPTYLRLNINRIKGIDIINDSYNSNPVSMMRALDVIRHYPARAKWVVSGDMLELGRHGIRFHRMIGSYIAKSNVQGLLTLGELSKHTLSEAKECGIKKDRLWHCTTHEEVADVLKSIVRKGDVVLLKGSRGMNMEKVVERLKE